jgi:hypothetical protein
LDGDDLFDEVRRLDDNTKSTSSPATECPKEVWILTIVGDPVLPIWCDDFDLEL